ncbi:restriction endonuclease subunit S [Undibacterium oligocarboniphilum]|uniref:Restriction endonuclease subunit S n=1 Tax=Undibacterium oligocarboniphilum TaxID=666702 RepID=A0A850QIH8_9BURK|nr:restriction endonuclease subunit S [Undibacterium oligocarboniphilum]MBC3871527.1 restriction endonuclease subunit S [Undibacterium oligocarboniphilum]NVO78897.1 restriction endonuclease subunit S [Undibacterium oligocarboniphilum]
MSHYKPYPAYRDSGVEWIGQLPEHWARASIKHILSAPITDGPHETPVFLNEGVEFLSVDGIQDGELAFEGKRFISYEDHARFCKKAKPKINDVLVGKSASVGKVARVKTSNDFNVWSPLAILRSDPTKCNPTYLEFALKADSAQQQILLAGNTSTQANIGMDRLASVGIPLPPITEQHQLTKAIEQETARIEALIAKKTRFIELLKEKRQALITHAVTKGLDPNVKMKDSGVEWIGEVPEHWSVCKLSYRYSVELGKMLDEKRITGEHLVPYLRNKDVRWDEINTADLPVMDICPDEIERYTIKDGDLLVCEGGDVGRAAIWRGGNNVIGYQKALHRLRSISSDKDSVEFYAYVLGAAKRNGVFEEGDTKSTISHLPAEKFREYRFAFPPLNEQAQIVASLTRDSARIDRLTEKTQRSIDLLKERRAAFITAAVTGQIDLREIA